MKAHYYTILLEGDCTIQGDVVIEESALNIFSLYFKISYKLDYNNCVLLSSRDIHCSYYSRGHII